MLFDPKRGNPLARLEEQLRCADAVTPELVSTVITEVCARFSAHRPSARSKIGRLIEAGAWTEAARALVELELPQWKLRRLVYDDGEWLCSLSKEPRLPLGLDDVAEASHEVLPLAILSALVQAQHATAASAANLISVPQVPATSGYAVCCDNFV